MIDLSGFEKADMYELKLSQIVHQDSLKYIKLETAPQSMLAIIFNLDLTSQYLFLQSGPDLLVYDIEGDFVKYFDKYGRGPGEHLGILGFAVTDSLVLIISN